eukprot:TRINITY_DN25879_c0_g1_i1.p1 TRINITY_DN25879_c0_g1~~TRINITY_DN25879_c0_g1_i1.p1  ORF type:complete len:804 (+),score=214.06 TRINITY_DN25879_c0_g1_i1:65-2413(+)
MSREGGDEEAAEPVSETAALQKALLEKDDELRTWRIRAMQAEAEVRALKRSNNRNSRLPLSPTVTGTSEPRSPLSADHRSADGGSPKKGVLWEASVQTDVEQPAVAGSPKRAETGNSSATDVDELHNQLSVNERTIRQLQDDMRKEQQLREKQCSEMKSQQVREMTQREELREMTQRALEFKHKWKAAKDMAREEHAVVRQDLEECEARLSIESSAKSEFKNEQQALEAELRKLRSPNSEEGAEAESGSLSERLGLEERMAMLSQEAESAQEQRAAAVAELQEVMSSADAAASEDTTAAWQDAWKGRQTNIARCLGSLRQLHTELTKELRGGRGGLQRSVSTRGGRFSGEEVLTRIAQQVEKAHQLVEGPLPLGPNRGLRDRRATVAGSSARASSPETERLFPEDLKRGTSSSSVASPAAAAAASQSRESEEALQQRLDMNDFRIQAELAREKMVVEHCDEMDDLVRRHDKERKELHREVMELRSECARAEVSDTIKRPMRDIRNHFESQVAVVKQELVAQLADIQERQRVQRGQDEQEMGELRKSLERCQSELSSSQYEFATLAMLFDKEQKENQRLQHLRLQQQNSEMDASQQEANVAETVGTPVPSEMANNATFASTQECSPDTTLATDTLPMAALAAASAAAEAAQRAGAAASPGPAEVSVKISPRSVKTADDSRDAPTTVLNQAQAPSPAPSLPSSRAPSASQAPRHGISSVSMLRGALAPQSRTPGPTATLSPSVTTSSASAPPPSAAVHAVMAAASKLQKTGTPAATNFMLLRQK